MGFWAQVIAGVSAHCLFWGFVIAVCSFLVTKNPGAIPNRAECLLTGGALMVVGGALVVLLWLAVGRQVAG